MMRSPPYQHRSVSAMTILVVDDDKLIRDMLIDYLTDEGYAAEGAANGREAFYCMRMQPFQLVLLDIMMPILNGWQLLEAMQAEPVFAAIPVVMMTAAANVRERALEQGAIGYVSKPLD